jgi:hypothetical protein
MSLNVITNGAPPAAPAAAPVADAAPDSALAQARAAAARQRAQQMVDIPVGGQFGEHLLIRYGVLPLNEIERYADLQTSAWSMNIDVMVSACRTVIWRDGQDTKTDFEVRLDHHLLTKLEYPLPPGIDRAEDLTAREVVQALFNDNGLALANHFAQLQKWMENPGGDAPGESSAAGG